MIVRTEQDRRKLMVRKARKEFIETGKTNDITTAVRLYFQAHPKETQGIKETLTPREIDRPTTILDLYERPPCPKCGMPLFFQVCSTCGSGKRKKNEWICKSCSHRRITKDTLEEALAKLERKKKEEPQDEH